MGIASFSDFYHKTDKGADDSVYSLITSPTHIGYFLTISDDYSLFSDETKVICADNKIDLDTVNIKKLYNKFRKQYA